LDGGSAGGRSSRLFPGSVPAAGGAPFGDRSPASRRDRPAAPAAGRGGRPSARAVCSGGRRFGGGPLVRVCWARRRRCCSRSRRRAWYSGLPLFPMLTSLQTNLQ
jgi:hypothetical protein